MNVFAILGLMIDDLSTISAQFLSLGGDAVECCDDDAVRRYVEPIIREHNTSNYVFLFGMNGLETIDYNDADGQAISCNVADKIRDYVDHYGTSELYHRMCEEVLNLT